MARIAAVSIKNSDARSIIDSLRMVGRADDVTAAHAIERAIENLAPVDDLTPAERAAVVRVLDGAPARFRELRAVLARDHD